MKDGALSTVTEKKAIFLMNITATALYQNQWRNVMDCIIFSITVETYCYCSGAWNFRLLKQIPVKLLFHTRLFKMFPTQSYGESCFVFQVTIALVSHWKRYVEDGMMPNSGKQQWTDGTIFSQRLNKKGNTRARNAWLIARCVSGKSRMYEKYVALPS